MGLRFIFMLTRHDRTVADAAEHLHAALAAGVRDIGFKDIGLPLPALRELNAQIQQAGATSYLEVVSLDQRSELVSAQAAVDFGVNRLLGGTHVEAVLPLLAGTGIEYFPFPGRVAGHPSVLEGSLDEIVASARTLAAHAGVSGLDLLAYRARADAVALMQAVCAVVDKPVIVAGSIGSAERLAQVQASGAAWFTIGTAALDGLYDPQAPDLRGQLTAILRDHLRLAPPFVLCACQWLAGHGGTDFCALAVAGDRAGQWLNSRRTHRYCGRIQTGNQTGQVDGAAARGRSHRARSVRAQAICHAPRGEHGGTACR